MAQLIKKEKISIVIGEYQAQDGTTKKKRRTIGEMVTMMGDDGQPYQFGELWGAGGVSSFNVYPVDDDQQQQQVPQQGYQQPQQGYQQPQQPQGQPNYHQQQTPPPGYQNRR